MHRRSLHDATSGGVSLGKLRHGTLVAAQCTQPVPLLSLGVVSPNTLALRVAVPKVGLRTCIPSLGGAAVPDGRRRPRLRRAKACGVAAAEHEHGGWMALLRRRSVPPQRYRPALRDSEAARQFM
eukprot:SAG11_NODE_10149_length_851_cov_1.232713_1_plen_125_part_00